MVYQGVGCMRFHFESPGSSLKVTGLRKSWNLCSLSVVKWHEVA